MKSKKLNVILCPVCKKYQHFNKSVCTGCGAICTFSVDQFGQIVALPKPKPKPEIPPKVPKESPSVKKMKERFTEDTLMEKYGKDVLAYIDRKGWATVNEIAKFLGVTYGTAHKTVHAYYKRGKLDRVRNLEDGIMIMNSGYNILIYYRPGHRPTISILDDKGERICQYLREHGPSQACDIKEGIGFEITRSAVYGILTRMEARGLVIRKYEGVNVLWEVCEK